MRFIMCTERADVPGGVGFIFESGFVGAYDHQWIILSLDVFFNVLEDRKASPPSVMKLTEKEFDFVTKYDPQYPRSQKISDVLAHRQRKSVSEKFVSVASSMPLSSGDELFDVSTNLMGNMLRVKNFHGHLFSIGGMGEFGNDQGLVNDLMEIYVRECRFFENDFGDISQEELEKALASWQEKCRKKADAAPLERCKLNLG